MMLTYMCKRIVICERIHVCEGGLAADSNSNGSSEIVVVVVIHALMHTTESRWSSTW